jgi:N-acetylmuramoyl-L-alanine amidase
MTLLWIEKINNQKMLRFFILLLLVTFPFHAMAGDVTDIRFGDHPDKTRLVIDFNGDTDFQAKMNSDNALVIHLRQKQANGLGDTMKPPFDDLTIKPTGQFTQLLFTLQSPHRIRTAYVIAGDPNRLVVDIVAGTPNYTTHGPLQTDAVTKRGHPLNKKPIIMIDAGHGGVDPGAVSPSGIREKDITLAISLMIADILNKTRRYEVRLTLETDRFIRLYDRVKKAREADADIFLSIHADSVRGGERISGASVYTLSETASDAQTAALAKRENAVDLIGGFDAHIEDDSIHAMLVDMSMQETKDNSIALANMIVRGLKQKNVKTIMGPHRHAGFVVLKAPDIPSVLLETGFLSNEDQARDLLDPVYQNAIAQSVLHALDHYFDY